MSHVHTADDLGLRRSTPIGYRNTRPSVARTVSAGIIAGAVAGLAMAVAMAALFHFAMGKSPFLPFTLIGATVLNDPTLGASSSMMDGLVGFAVHLAVPSLGWGVAYGLLDVLARPQRASTLLFMGLAIGALAQVVDVNVLLPLLDSTHVIRNAWTTNVPAVVSWLVHLAYGIGLSFYPWKYDPASGRFV